MKLRTFKRPAALITVIVSAIVIIPLYLFFGNGNSKNDSKGNDKTVKLRRGNIVNVLNLSGKIVPHRMVEVKPLMSGEVQKLYLKAGDKVREGDPLAEIKPDPAVLVSLLQKEKSLWQANMDFSKKEKFYRDQKKLLEQHLISNEEFEDAEQEYLLSEKNQKLSQMDLDIFRRQNGLPKSESMEILNRNSQVTAPISGTILKVNLEPGTFVKSALSQYSEGTSIYTIGDLSKLTIKLAVPEININEFSPGESVIVSTENSGVTDSGKVLQVSPMADMESTPPTFDVTVEFSPKNDNFRPGMTGLVRLELERKNNVFILPIQAVSGHRSFKRVIVKGVYGPELVEVKTGVSDNHMIEIVSGLDSTAAVYLNPLEMFGKAIRRPGLY